MNEILRSFQSPQAILQTEDKINTFRTTFCYHRQVSMVSMAPSPLNGMVMVKPLGSMVFRWFWCQATIGFNGFRWLSAIDPTMEWLHTTAVKPLEYQV